MPVAVAAAGDELAVVLEDDLELEVVFFGEVNDAVPALGGSEVEIPGGGRGGFFQVAGPVKVGGTPVTHPDADPVELIFLEQGERGWKRGGGLMLVIPGVVKPDGKKGRAVGVGEAAGIPRVDSDGACGGGGLSRQAEGGGADGLMNEGNFSRGGGFGGGEELIKTTFAGRKTNGPAIGADVISRPVLDLAGR